MKCYTRAVMKTVLYVKASERNPSLRKCRGFMRGAVLHGWHVHVVTLAAKRALDVQRLIAFWKADGIVLDGGGVPPGAILGKLPAVFFSLPPQRGERVFTVGEDPGETAEAAARELLQLGYAHYAFVHFPQTRYWSNARADSFRNAILLNGGTYSEFASVRRANALAWAHELRKWIKALPKPCGIFAANDEVSRHIRGICTLEHMRMPNPIALVGVDNDLSICLDARPHLSSVLADNEQMGFLAARLLAQQFKGTADCPKRLLVPPLMVVRRDSTRSLAYRDHQVLEAIRLIREKACEGLRARDVLALFPCSRRAAEMRFRNATGHSILDEIQSVRMDHARELLNDRSRPLKVVANLCGYASESSFRKIYRAYSTPPPIFRPYVRAPRFVPTRSTLPPIAPQPPSPSPDTHTTWHDSSCMLPQVLLPSSSYPSTWILVANPSRIPTVLSSSHDTLLQNSHHVSLQIPDFRVNPHRNFRRARHRQP